MKPCSISHAAQAGSQLNQGSSMVEADWGRAIRGGAGKQAKSKAGWQWVLRMLAAALLLMPASGTAQSAYVFASQGVGTASAGQTLSITARLAGSVKAVQILTAGASGPGLDFQKGPGTSSCEAATLASAGATCQESVTFTPSAPGLRIGAVVLLDSQNHVLGMTFLSGTGTGGLPVLIPGNILPVAGDGAYLGAVQDGGPALQAELNHPSSIALDGAGNLYIADKFHHRIRMVCAASATINGVACPGPGIIITIAGNGNPAFGGDGGPASDSILNTPWGLALDGAGNLYIADTLNNVVRRIAAGDGTIATVAGGGTGCPGQIDPAGDGCPATSAALNTPQGVTVDAAGNLYIADTYNHRIRRVDWVTGLISTVAGNGTADPITGVGGYKGDGGPAVAAELNFPFAVAFDAAGNMYIPDSSNNVVRMVAASGGAIAPGSVITTFAGTGAAGFDGDGAPASLAALWSPSGVAVDPAGNVYIADTQNNAIRKASQATGFIDTIAQNGAGEYFFGGAFQKVSIYSPIGLFLDGSGNLYFADSLNMRVRAIQAGFAAIDYTAKPVRQGDLSVTKIETIENDGNATLDLTAIAPDANAALDKTVTSCAIGPPGLDIDASCLIGAVFAPTDAGDPLAGNIDVTGNPVDPILDIQLIGDATPVNSTTLTLDSSLDPSMFGQTVTFTATVTTGKTAGTPSGTITFYEQHGTTTTTLQSNVALNSKGVATYTTPALTVGLHTMTASYSGDATHFSSKSTDNATAALIQTVNEATSTFLQSSQNPAPADQNVTFTATVTTNGGGGVPPQGNVIFSDGATILGSAVLNTAGVAGFTTATPLSPGPHTITAVYGGQVDKQVLGSASASLTQEMQAPTNAQLGTAGSQIYANPVVLYGNPVTFTALVTGSGATVPSGAVVFFDGNQQIGYTTLTGQTGQASFSTSTLAIGPHSITFSYKGDAYYAPCDSAAITVTVTQAQTLTAVAAAPNPGIAGAPVALAATVTVMLGVSTPTGLVTFTDGTTSLGSAQVSAAGIAKLSPMLAPGPHSIVATYAGDTNDTGSASIALAFNVVQATTSTTVASTPNPAVVQSPVTLTARVSGNGGQPAGSVTFYADGAGIGSANLDATGTATLAYAGLAAGTHSLSASYAGDVNDAPSASASISQTIGTIPTITSLGTSASASTPPQAVLVATVLAASGTPPTGTVVFSVGSTVLGEAPLDPAGVATLTPNLATGTYSIVAVYSGDALHTASTSQAVSINGTPSGFSITVTPGSVTMATTQNASVTVGLNSENGFADTVGLGCASLPAGVTCHFSNPSLGLKANALQSTQLTIDTDNPLTGGSLAFDGRAGDRGALMAGLLLPTGLCFGLVLRRFRRRNGALWSVLLLMVLSGGALLAAGCGAFTQASAAPGTYVIQVTGTGVKSNIVHYRSVNLTITK